MLVSQERADVKDDFQGLSAVLENMPSGAAIAESVLRPERKSNPDQEHPVEAGLAPCLPGLAAGEFSGSWRRLSRPELLLAIEPYEENDDLACSCRGVQQRGKSCCPLHYELINMGCI